jgi:cold shock CspA family protein
MRIFVINCISVNSKFNEQIKSFKTLKFIMGKSQESFNKKEKEKIKQKKRQDKLAKKEERKSSSSEKKSLDDMIAYVDEDGNITSTPPDPNKKKKVIKKEDIQIGVSRQEAMDPADLIRKGTVTFFNESKGYGFIKDHVSQESIFVHINALSQPIKENDKVTFETEKGPKGLNAVRVKLIN